MKLIKLHSGAIICMIVNTCEKATRRFYEEEPKSVSSHPFYSRLFVHNGAHNFSEGG